MQVVQAEYIQGSQPRAQNSPFWALARQLQLRLRYARLKVDHGWQKQSLNEVENLYFHHHHFRDSPSNPPNLRSLPSDAVRLEGHASSSKVQGQELSPSVSVFSSRQQPSDILVLRPPDAPEQQQQQQQQQQSTGDDADMQLDDSTVDAVRLNLPASPSPATAAQLPAASFSAGGGDDFALGTPQASKVGDVGEIGSEDSLPTSHLTILSAATAPSPDTASVGQSVEQAANDSSHTDDSRMGQTPSPPRPAPTVAAPQFSSSYGTNAGAPALTPSHVAGKQATTAQSAHATTGSGRPSTLTYDSFWSSHAGNGVTYGYGPYTTSSQPVQGGSAISPSAGPAQVDVAPPPPPPPGMSAREVDVAMANAV